MTTLTMAVDQATQALTQARQQRGLPVESPRLDAQVLLCAVLGQERSYLYTHSDLVLSPEQERRWQEWLTRRLAGEPVAYILGQKTFFGLDFLVDRRVLIPRPETELLVERALQLCQARLGDGTVPLVADIGTGSGAIPISLAVHEPRLPYLYAVDISAEALSVSRENCRRHQVSERIRLLQGSLLEPVPEPVDLLLANLPYVGLDEQEQMLPDVLSYEPHLALFSGSDGLDLLRELLQQASQSQRLRPGAVLLLEIGYRQKAPLTHLALDLWPAATVSCIQDYAGWDRIMEIAIH